MYITYYSKKVKLCLCVYVSEGIYSTVKGSTYLNSPGLTFEMLQFTRFVTCTIQGGNKCTRLLIKLL